MAQSSSSSSANSDHDVFINHRGPDTKKTFASLLYNRLCLHDLRVFLDDPELRRGDELSVQIINAIKSASVHVAIFSPKYAESRWCLDELVWMLDTKKPIIPVFYDVEPEEVRGTRGKKRTYAVALDKLASETDYDGQTPRHDPSKIQKWRYSLREVAKSSGFELKACNGNEGELLEKVVAEVLTRVKKLALDRDVPKDAPGLDEKVAHFESFLLQRQQSEKPRIFGIVGLGGIGKTTLADKFCNKNKSDYSRSCYLSAVKDQKVNDLISSQKKLLGVLNVTDQEIKKVTDVAEGKAMIRKHLLSYKALVVIDDVDDKDQVDALLPDQSAIHPDSLILITSRYRDVLRKSNVEEESMYDLSILGEKHSRELFCLHSFNQRYPPPEFESLVEQFVEACGGLPLSLKVIGALLKRKSKSYWEDQWNKLGRKLPDEIKQVLQISYNALEEEEKEIFLDIACFFIGEDRDMVIRIVGESGFENIVDRCLLDVDREKRIKMHDHVRDMGRELAKGSGLPRRLWRWTEEDNDDLSQNSGIVRGVRIVYGRVYGEDSEDEDGEDEDEDGEYTEVDDRISMRSLQFLDAEGDLMERILRQVSSPNLKWLRWMHCNSSSFLPSSVPLKNLRVLKIKGNMLKTLWEEELEPPLQLRELEIKTPLSEIPKSIGQLNHLERIVICYRYNEQVSITKLPKEFCFLRSLKVLVLEGWSRMKALPECFGNLTELQHIQLSYCTALESLPQSFGKLTNLQHVDLSDCSALEELPQSFGKLTNLQHVDLSGCSALEELPQSFGKLTKLQHLDLGGCLELSLQRETLGNISTLKYIDLSECEKIEVLPSQVAHQRSLEQLLLNGTNLKELPIAIGKLSCMEVLQLRGCPLLDRLPPLYYLKNLKELSIFWGKELEFLPYSLCDLKSLKDLVIWCCKKLKCLPLLLGDLSNLNKLEIIGCDELKRLPTSIGRLTQLTYLKVSQCPLIRELPLEEEIVIGKRGTLNDSQILPRLQELEVSETGISKVSFAERVCCELRHLSIERCNNLVKVGKLPNTLIHLSFSGCHNLSGIDQIHGPEKLQYLNISQCIELEELPSIETLISLRSLDATGCVKLKSIRVLGQLTELKSLEVASCSELEELEGIQHCIRLGKLNAKKCVKLKKIRGLEQLKKLQQLCIEGCSDLEEVEGIERCSNLEHLQDCKSSLEIDARECPKLQLGAGVKRRLRKLCSRAEF